MKFQALRIFLGKLGSNQLLLLAFTLLLLTLIKLHLDDSSGSLPSQPPEIKSDGFTSEKPEKPVQPPEIKSDSLSSEKPEKPAQPPEIKSEGFSSEKPEQPPEIKPEGFSSEKPEKKCDIFSGTWVENPKGSYYDNRTCEFQLLKEINCRKYGRTDEEFLNWRWRPDECELPLFDGAEFLEVLRGKTLAFVGDSIARNQMQSLLCLLSYVASPQEIYKQDTFNIKFRSWFYAGYNVTLSSFWSPYLVKTKDSDPTSLSSESIENIYLDEADEVWTAEIESFDYVILSAGIWFFRPLMLYENDRLVGCHSCGKTNVTNYDELYGYRKAFRTAFSTLNRLPNFKGVTFLRTVSPAHYENGEWNTGGTCRRKAPVTRAETKVRLFTLRMMQTQMEEFAEAEKKGLERGLEFRVVNVTWAMAMRPDGHPNYYVKEKDATSADCVHWCVPGPIDVWNQFLLYLLKT